MNEQTTFKKKEENEKEAVHSVRMEFECLNDLLFITFIFSIFSHCMFCF